MMAAPQNTIRHTTGVTQTAGAQWNVGGQFVFDQNLVATSAAAQGARVVVATSPQGDGVGYIVNVAESLRDIFGSAPASGASTATFTGIGVPAGWTCLAQFYGDGDACDCGCGVPDPDGATTTAASCDFCDNAGSCGTGDCPANIDPVNNAVCL